MTEKSEVKISGSTLEIKNFKFANPAVAATFQNELDNGGDLVKFLENVIAIGTTTLGAANAGAGVVRIQDSLENTESVIKKNVKHIEDQLQGSAKKLNEDFQKIIESLTGDESPLASQVSELLESFTEQIEGLTASEDSPIRAGIKKQISDMASRLLADFTAQSAAQKTELQKLLNPSNEGSPFAVFANQLEALQISVRTINDSLVSKQAAEIEGKKGTAKGRTFEKAVLDVIASIATGSGDDAEHTGDDEGLYDKMGDGVVVLREGTARVARVAVEAKNKKMTMAAWQKEASGAMKNRDAHGFIGVCKSIDQMPNKTQLVALDDFGQQLVVCFDPDSDQPKEFLALVYQVVKMHTLTTRNGAGEVNAQALRLFVDQSIKQLDKFNRLVSLASGIKGEADKIISEADDLSFEISRHLQSLKRELAGVEPATLAELGDSTSEEEAE